MCSFSSRFDEKPSFCYYVVWKKPPLRVVVAIRNIQCKKIPQCVPWMAIIHVLIAWMHRVNKYKTHDIMQKNQFPCRQLHAQFNSEIMQQRYVVMLSFCDKVMVKIRSLQK